MIFAGFGVEVFMSFAILTGIADRMAAVILAVIALPPRCVEAILEDARFSSEGRQRGREMFWDFLKNFALAGGFLALAFGASASGFQQFLAHPLASSHPYSFSEKRRQMNDRPIIPYWHLWTDADGISQQEQCAMTEFD